MISQFSSISKSTGDGVTYTEPARTFASALAVSNLDVLNFGAGCSIPHATFYTTLVITVRVKGNSAECDVCLVFSYAQVLKTTLLPLGPPALLWIWAVIVTKRGNRRAWGVCYKLSLFWIEMVLTTGE